MFRPRHLVRVSLPVAALAVAFVVAANLPADQPGEEAARLDVFDKYFALSLQPSLQMERAESHDITVLVDTSASQMGDFRAKSLASLDVMLKALGPQDRVRLVAVDIDSVPMTDGFVAISDVDAINAAVAKLHERTPLGTTDLPAALEEAASAYGDNIDRPRSIVYLGDGMSMASVIAEEEMVALTEEMTSKQIAITSLAIGPHINGVLLAALANHSGGTMFIDSVNFTADEIGHFLANSAAQSVFWAESIELPEVFDHAYPKRIPPFRADRDTVLVGTGIARRPFEVRVRGKLNGQPHEMTWQVKPAVSNEDNAYLAALVDSVEENDGVMLAALGTPGLHEIRRSAVELANRLGNMAGQSLQIDPNNAKRLAQGVLELDPNNEKAEAIARLANTAKGGDMLVNLQDPPAAGGQPGEIPAPNQGQGQPPVAQPGQGGDLLNQFTQDQRILAQRLSAEVINTVTEARSDMTRNPTKAINDLRYALDAVNGSTVLDDGARAQLVGQIESALRAAQVAQEEFDARQALEQEREAEYRAVQRMLTEQQNREDTLTELMALFNAHMADGLYREAESLADAARELAPRDPSIAAADLGATMVGSITEAYLWRRARTRGVLETLAAVERSHIPTPDEPPIVYPPADVWRALTERRREYDSVDLSNPNPAERRIQAELENQTNFQFQDIDLVTFAQVLSDQHGILVVLDRQELEQFGLDPETTFVTANYTNITLRSALRLTLPQNDLGYYIDNEVLLITSREKADTQLVTKVYPVADLVIPIQPPQAFGGLGGGFGGGFGGGGLGGGGFGGGGFGGGGFGGGFGGGAGRGVGGGAANVPSHPQDADKEQAQSAVKIGPVEKPVTQLPAVRAEVIELAIEDGANVDQAWDAHLAASEFSGEALRITAKKLMNDRKFNEVVALINASLKHQKPQPWMYESLSLALMAADRRDEVERALMSAADFTSDVDEIMYLAQYMSRFGYNERALKLYQQVARVAPTRHEPYVLGMELAKELNDVDGIRWAVVGIVSQAWDQKEKYIWDNAIDIAQAKYDELVKDGKKPEADNFIGAVTEALQRDLLIEVVYTGDAQVDLMVEEPAGTICSFRAPRTTSGGVLVSNQLDGPIKGARSEVYVCPEGFNGRYRARIRRVFGEPNGGQVKVTVIKNFRGEKSVVETKLVPVDDKDAMVVVDLESGRRVDSLQEHQVIAAARQHEAIGQQVLMQQLGNVASNPNSDDFNFARRRNMIGQPFGRGGRNGALGFQPVITTLPEGTNMTVNAVISADRRYVRIGAAPTFSAISEVNTFNLASGATNQTNQGGFGGGGFGGGLGGQGGGFGGGGFGGGGQFGGGGFGGGGQFGGGGFGGGQLGGGGFGGGGFGGGGLGGGVF